MRRVYALALIAAAFGLQRLSWTWPAASQIGGAPPAGALSLRIIFGDRQEQPKDYSGSIAISAGKVREIKPWRFSKGDTIAGAGGWKLRTRYAAFENQPNRERVMTSTLRPRNLVPVGVTVTVDAPPTATIEIKTAAGSYRFPLSDVRYDRVLSFEAGDIVVQPTPSPARINEPSSEEHDYPSFTATRSGTVWTAWQAYQNNGDHVYARHSTPAGWSQTFRLSEPKGDVFQTAVAEDARGRIVVVWSERTGEDWHLYSRAYDGRAWSPRRQITSASAPNIWHRLVSSPAGELQMVWVGYQGGQSRLHWSAFRGDAWSEPVEISGGSAWAPDAAFDSKGNLYVVWDSYRNGNYDIFLRRISAGGALGPIEQLTRSPLFEAHPTVAVDKQDRVWVAWDESGGNWGKDWTHEDPFRSTVLYADRRPRVAVWADGKLQQPVPALMATVPLRYHRYVQLPRVACDAAGRVWIALQIRTSSSGPRADYHTGNGRWEHFLTTLEGDHWTPLMPIPETSQRPEGPFRLQAGPRGVWMVWATDNRVFGGDGQPHEIRAASFEAAAAVPPPRIEPFTDAGGVSNPIHPKEAEDVARIRGYRARLAGAEYRLVRGDFHRHTEISGDGSGDGSIEDNFRYMLDAAQMDTGILGDHDAGGTEYSWWRTEKAIDIFHIKGRFTPLFGYERSVAYPNGHRNVILPRRGVPVLRVGDAEQSGEMNTGQVLYPYLRQHRGICTSHSLATGQGTDYRDNDPDLEPMVELYQGYHASYEYEGAPRAETENYIVNIHGGYRPAGFWWTALAKGLKLGVQASSDHISTHTSYALVYTPAVGRTDIIESMRRRRVYAATDNIILDVRAEDSRGGSYMMGSAFEASAPPRISVKVIGTAKIARVDVVKDGKFVFHAEPDDRTSEFTYVDAAPGNRESYYYVRVMQSDRNLAWSSPIWVKYAGL